MHKTRLFFVLTCVIAISIGLAFLFKGHIGGMRSGDIQYFYANGANKDKFDPDLQLQALIKQNPTNDALSAFQSGDKHFVGVFGITILMPGMFGFLKAHPQFLDQVNGVKVIQGTSDYAQTEQEAEINAAAEKYAVGYNTCLINLETNR